MSKVFGMNVRGNPVVLGGLSTQGTKTVSKDNLQNIQPIRLSGGTAQYFNSSTIPTQLSFANVVSPIIPSPREVRTATVFMKPSGPIQVQRIDPDNLNLSEYTTTNDGYDIASTNGITSYRPEILASIDWSSLYRAGLQELSDSGKLLYTTYQIVSMRNDAEKKIVDKITTDPELSFLAQSLKKENDNKFAEAERRLGFINANVRQVQDLKSAFDFKNTSDKFYNNTGFLTPKEFFARRMQYPYSSFSVFSDTKILMQMVFDGRSMSETHSLGLLNTVDTDRGEKDKDPIRLDKTYGDSGPFTMTGFSGKYAHVENNYSSLNSSLPNNHTDKIKLLISSLSKELRVSKGLSKPGVRKKLIEYYGATPDGNPFDNLFGNVGDDIFEIPQGEKSLASLLALKVNSTTVLPWERKVVDDGQTSYLPGNLYFLDTVLKVTNGKFNTRPFEDYTQLFSDRVSSASVLANELLEFNTPDSKLSPEGMLRSFLESMKDGLKGNATNTEQNVDQLIVSGLVRLAATDFKLKFMILQFLLLLASATSTIKTANAKKVFQRIAQEISEIKNLSYVKVAINNTATINGGMEALRPFLLKLAEDIETHVFKLISPKSLNEEVFGNEAATTISRNIRDLSAFPTSGSAVRGISEMLLTQGSAINVDNLQNKTTTDISQKSQSDLEVLIKTNLGNGSISQALLNCSTVGGQTVMSNVLNEVFDLTYIFDTAASISGNDRSYVLGSDVQANGQSTTTRFNQITTTMLFAFVYEAIVAFTAHFFDVTIKRDSLLSNPYLTANQTKNNYSLELFNELTRIPSKKNLNFSLKSSTPKKSVSIAVGASNATNSESTSSGQTQSRTGIIDYSNIPGLGTNNPNFTDPEQAKAKSAGDLSNSMLQVSYGKNKSLAGALKINTGGASTNMSTGTAQPSSAIDGVFGSGASNILTEQNGLDRFDTGKSILANPQLLAKYNSLRSSIYDIKIKTLDEDKTLENIFFVFNSLAKQMVSKKDQMLHFFKQSEAELLSSNLVASDFDLMGSNQLMTSNWLLVDQKEKHSNASLSDNDEFHSILSMAKESVYSNKLSDKRTKLMVVGIPAGLSTKLLDRVSVNAIDSSFESEREADVISITVYKKSSEDDDLVFYPQKFLFDLSLYPLKIHDLGIDPNESFDQILDRLALADLSKNYTNYSVDKVGIQDLNGEKLSFLSNKDKKDLFKNHITSQLLERCVAQLSNLSFKEDVFLKTKNIGSGLETSAALEALLRGYLRKYANLGSQQETISFTAEGLAELQVSEKIKKDIKMLLTSPKLNSEVLTRKIMEPKKFDRIFIIPVNIDSFVIDEEQTKQSASGFRAFSNGDFFGKLSKVSEDSKLLYKDRSLEPNAMILEEYFVTIESVNK